MMYLLARELGSTAGVDGGAPLKLRGLLVKRKRGMDLEGNDQFVLQELGRFPPKLPNTYPDPIY